MFTSRIVSRLAVTTTTRSVNSCSPRLVCSAAAATSSSSFWCAPSSALATSYPTTTTTTTTRRCISSDLRDKLLEEKDNFVVYRTAAIQQKKAEAALEHLTEIADLASRDEALAVLAVFFQQGGTARSADGNMSVEIFGKSIKLAMVRHCLKGVNFAKGERKLARSFANEIAEIATVLELPGNLSNKIVRNNLDREFTMEEKVWLSDFQSDNENCPADLRQLILDTFKKKAN